MDYLNIRLYRFLMCCFFFFYFSVIFDLVVVVRCILLDGARRSHNLECVLYFVFHEKIRGHIQLTRECDHHYFIHYNTENDDQLQLHHTYVQGIFQLWIVNHWSDLDSNCECGLFCKFACEKEVWRLIQRKKFDKQLLLRTEYCMQFKCVSQNNWIVETISMCRSHNIVIQLFVGISERCVCVCVLN